MDTNSWFFCLSGKNLKVFLNRTILHIFQYYKTDFLKSITSLWNILPLFFFFFNFWFCTSFKACSSLDWAGKVSLSPYSSQITLYLNHLWLHFLALNYLFILPVVFRWCMSWLIAFVSLHKGWCSKKCVIENYIPYYSQGRDAR